jgi:hypothetical protein
MQALMNQNITMLRVFSIPFDFTCSLIFFDFDVLKLSTGMVHFSKFETSKHKKHRSPLLIHQKQIILCLAFHITERKSFLKIKMNWFTIHEPSKIYKQ